MLCYRLKQVTSKAGRGSLPHNVGRFWKCKETEVAEWVRQGKAAEESIQEETKQNGG
jgi:hypothetical protein